MRDDLADFPHLSPRRSRSPVSGHLVILAAFALTLLAYHFSYDHVLGKGAVTDGLGGALLFLVIAYYVGWLPALWRISRGSWADPLVLPVLILLFMPYLYFTFLAYYLQPMATILALFIHLLTFTFLSFRI